MTIQKCEPLTTPSGNTPVPITVAFGDGIGPEIMQACLKVLLAGGARLALESIEVGENVYLAGQSSGIPASAWDSLRRSRVFYKAPITTPQGGGYKSLNVTIRKTLGLLANVRPCVAHAPAVQTRHPGMDVVIVRENEEDLYAGIEHRQTDDVYQCLKLISRPGCERIARYAFDYARAHGRSKVTCFSKDNIMKLTDGLFHRVFNEVAAQYPDIAAEHMIVDIGAARLADTPERFDVIVMPNLYGDILSDVAAQISGSVGMAPSANIGEHCAMFEAVHGSAPDIAGMDVANPSGLLLAGVMMLTHIGQQDVAERVHNAWLATIEAGIHTADIFRPGTSVRKVGTAAFAEEVIARLGCSPEILKPVLYPAGIKPVGVRPCSPRVPARKTLVGCDVFLHATAPVDVLAAGLKAAADPALDLMMITNRGIKVWPDGLPETFCTDHWRCRFLAKTGEQPNQMILVDLLARLTRQGFDVIKTENLFEFDGVAGFSLGQGQ